MDEKSKQKQNPDQYPVGTQIAGAVVALVIGLIVFFTLVAPILGGHP